MAAKKKATPEKTRERRVSVGGVLFVAHLPVASSASGAHEGWLDETLERHDLAIGAWLVEHGARTGDSLRWLRKTLGMKALELAEVLGVTPETISRWENDRLEIDPVAWVVIGAILRDHAAGETHTVDALRAARSRPKLPNAAVRLEIA